MLHVLLDPAEVLAVYALCGALLILFRRVPSPAVLVAAIALMGLPYLHTAIVTPIYRAEVPAQMAQDESVEADSPVVGEQSEEFAQAEESDNSKVEEDEDAFSSWDPYLGPRAIEVYSHGTLGDVVTYNRRFTVNRWTGSWAAWRVGNHPDFM